MSIKHYLNRVYRRVKYGYRASSEDFVKHLKAHGCDIGEGVHFFDPVKCIIDPVRLEYIKIGKYSKFTSNFTLLAHDYSCSVLIHTHKEILPPGGRYTTIGDNCFIGMNVTVMGGVTIGDNVIVGTNSVVTKDIPSNCICAGNPAKVIMTLDNYYEKRKRQYCDDVKRCVNHIRNKKKREPNIRELGIYSLLFLERTEENWNKYISGIKYPGCDTNEVKYIFFNTKPEYSSFEEFLKSCK